MSQLTTPGSCLVHDALGVPIVVVRGRNGALRAMLNVCRQRGANAKFTYRIEEAPIRWFHAELDRRIEANALDGP